MKKIFTVLTLGLALSSFKAKNAEPDSWKITWNKKVILQTSKSDESANTRKIKSGDLKKNYTLDISYKESDPKKEKEWIRSFMIFDEKDAELLRKDSTRQAKISAAELKKLFAANKKLKIYTIAIPSDPEMAARVRVRRVHLCTLQLQ
ncbi:MAG TPA: hypothetical protein VFI06_11395 [Chitinophagaceae bacterium]|nr:hypothetical protein [Chitinophagaceae bacterium]